VLSIGESALGAAMAVGMVLIQGEAVRGRNHVLGAEFALVLREGSCPLIKRLPRKRGFVNIFRIEYNVVNVGKLKVFAPNTEVTPQELLKARLVKSLKRPVKVLGDGEIDRPLVVRVDKFSAAAERKIVAVGGRVEAI